jgi:hypothetical protein
MPLAYIFSLLIDLFLNMSILLFSKLFRSYFVRSCYVYLLYVKVFFSAVIGLIFVKHCNR